jgi:signal transduction histidine kinase
MSALFAASLLALAINLASVSLWIAIARRYKGERFAVVGLVLAALEAVVAVLMVTADIGLTVSGVPYFLVLRVGAWTSGLALLLVARYYIVEKRLRQEQQRTEQTLRESEALYRAVAEDSKAANAELEAFSYSVAHDLRAPLRAIDGFSQALLEDCNDVLGPEHRDHLRRVRAAATRMAELIDDLLQLSRITRADLERKPVDLSKLARSIGDDLQRGAPARHVEIEVESDLTVSADARLLRVALTNLLDNAWKFTEKKPDGHIQIGAKQHNGARVFFVKDDGAGFDASGAKRLFAPFQRYHRASDFDGTGIGLATVKRVIHRHGGRIWAESTPGQGATFYFTLRDSKV